MRWNGILAFTIVALLAAASPAAADTFVVNTVADDTGTCATSCSIRQAIVSAEQNPGPDTIQIPANEYSLTQGPLQITTPVTITGAAANQTYIYATQGSRVFQIAGTTAAISRLTMAGGTATAAAGYFGGNLWAQSSTVTLDHVRVTGGSAYSGGGLSNRNGTLTVTNSLLAHNAANQGGSDGGAIVNFGGDGGTAANLTVRNSTLAYNSAGNSGAINQWGNDADTTTLENTTVAYNNANAFTGGINAGAGTISVRNSLLANNTLASANSNCGSTGIISLGHNVDDGGTTCNFGATGDVSDVNAGLQPDLAQDGSDTEILRFQTPSPARDIGGTCSSTDQVGHARYGACDAGAWEFPEFKFLSAPAGPSNHPPTFTWSGPYATYQCSIVGVAGTGSTCTSPYTAPQLPAGTYTLEIEAPDDATITQEFKIGTVAPDATVTPTPLPTATPTPTPTPTPEPVRNKSLEVEPQGTVLIKDKSGKFVPLQPGVIPNGSEIDATRGSVTITTSTGEKATFSDGRFKISQSGGITTATLSEPLDCTKAGKGKASAAAKKTKTRKLWGDGKGKFRTKGSYSAATVRGTKWLVQDTCTTTLTRVAQGVVQVEDFEKHVKKTLRKGKTYTARAKKK